jgi:hypothetical protein
MSASKELKFRYESGCLIVIATGSYLIDHKEAAIKAVAATIKARSLRALLTDMRGLTKSYGFMDRYQLGELAGRYLSTVPIATLNRVDQLDPEHIGQVVAKNRGASAEVFADEAEAYAWLKQYQTPKK